ncbi:hypothetical protein Nepgr_015435 [Nepenthes gracilis]|uniref:DM2 domain-containing protein n=1 Tax=Nepenthes gracilis TaxID=150966 RepID=A0AAD3SMT3_NEPGR|nr:hypothetical protein Nepgr_015435 [Nepenthes gracilis]
MAMYLRFSSAFLAGVTPFVNLADSPVRQAFLPPITDMRTVRVTTYAVASNRDTSMAGKREPRGIMKPRPVSPEMQAFLGGVSEIPRTEALKLIWAYIKQNNLQDPENKKVIVCDEKLKKIFAGKERVGFLEIAGLINPHFLK